MALKSAMGTALIFGVGVGLFLAYANGANDNFKGVATLFGSGTTAYRPALWWATGTTALGSVAAVFVANGLLEAFKGKGLVPPEVAATAAFGLTAALAAAITVFLATRVGLPISTTHSLIGALVGAGWFASTDGVYLEKLGSKFLLPLMVSPVLAILGCVDKFPNRSDFSWMVTISSAASGEILGNAAHFPPVFVPALCIKPA